MKKKLVESDALMDDLNNENKILKKKLEKNI